MLHLEHCNSKPLLSPGPDLIIETDASRSGWGATANGQMVKGHWTMTESEDQINALELRAVWLALKTLAKDRVNCHVHVRADNVTAVSHINRMGGTRSSKLVGITLELWQFCLDRQIFLSAEYLPGKLNTGADRLSRIAPEVSDWQLDNQVFAKLAKL